MNLGLTQKLNNLYPCDMRVGFVQYAPLYAKPFENWKHIRGLINHKDTDLLVLPELAFTGYLFLSRDKLLPLAEPLPEGHIFNEVLEFSKKKNMAIAYGFPLKENSKIYNAAVFISPEGFYHVYKKVHLFGTEKKVFHRGDSFQIFSYRDVKFGFLICYDWAFPESARVLALKGAQVLLHPANLVLHYAQEAMKVRAIENHIFVITANRIGSESVEGHTLTFRGKSQIVDPRGKILLNAQEDEGVFEVDICPEESLDKTLSEGNDLFYDREPRAYGKICLED